MELHGEGTQFTRVPQHPVIHQTVYCGVCSWSERGLVSISVVFHDLATAAFTRSRCVYTVKSIVNLS